MLNKKSVKNVNSLPKDMLEIGVGSIFAGMSAGILEQSSLPTPIKQGTGGLIGVGLIAHTGKKIQKYL